MDNSRLVIYNENDEILHTHLANISDYDADVFYIYLYSSESYILTSAKFWSSMFTGYSDDAKSTTLNNIIGITDIGIPVIERNYYRDSDSSALQKVLECRQLFEDADEIKNYYIFKVNEVDYNTQVERMTLLKTRIKEFIEANGFIYRYGITTRVDNSGYSFWNGILSAHVDNDKIYTTVIEGLEYYYSLFYFEQNCDLQGNQLNILDNVTLCNQWWLQDKDRAQEILDSKYIYQG